MAGWLATSARSQQHPLLQHFGLPLLTVGCLARNSERSVLGFGMADRAVVAGDHRALRLAAGCVGAFVISSMAVQLVRSNQQTVPAGASSAVPAASLQPVVAHQATLWADLGQR
jgi:hypothetical protein